MTKYKTISCSVTGYRKKMDNLPCEDATRVLHTKEGAIIAVADGHGDKRCLFASVGSQLATQAACNVLKQYLKSINKNASEYWNGLRDEIATDIAKAFANLVILDYQSRCKENILDQEVIELQNHIRRSLKPSDEIYTPAQLREMYMTRKRLDDKLSQILYLYGTTVRATVLTDTYLFNCSLGDGDTIAVINGKVVWLLPQTTAFECETASLCEPMTTVLDEFLFSFVELKADKSASYNSVADVSLAAPVVILATDGLRNSFFSEKLFVEKIMKIADKASSADKALYVSSLRKLYNKLSMESVFQDDISTIIAVIK